MIGAPIASTRVGSGPVLLSVVRGLLSSSRIKSEICTAPEAAHALAPSYLSYPSHLPYQFLPQICTSCLLGAAKILAVLELQGFACDGTTF